MNTAVLKRTPSHASTSAIAPTVSRRRLLRASAALIASPMLAPCRPSLASAAAPRALAFRHTHTGEELSITYAAGDSYFPDAMARIRWLLRDFRNDETRAIDAQLLDQLHALAAITGSRGPYDVISGYRSPATNEALRRRSGGVAAHSLHLEGRAIDIRLADVTLSDLRDAAISLRAGGVGFYPQSEFLHVDTGRVRRW